MPTPKPRRRHLRPPRPERTPKRPSASSNASATRHPTGSSRSKRSESLKVVSERVDSQARNARSGRPTGAPLGRTRCVRCIGMRSARASSQSEGARPPSLSQRGKVSSAHVALADHSSQAIRKRRPEWNAARLGSARPCCAYARRWAGRAGRATARRPCQQRACRLFRRLPSGISGSRPLRSTGCIGGFRQRALPYSAIPLPPLSEPKSGATARTPAESRVAGDQTPRRARRTSPADTAAR